MKENLLKIFEFNQNDELLQYIEDEFTKNNIVYNIELVEDWKGLRIAKYIPKFIVYVQKDKVNEAKKILEKFSIVELKEDEQINLEEYESDPNYNIEKEIKKRNKKQKIILIILALPVIFIFTYVIIEALKTFFQLIIQNIFG